MSLHNLLNQRDVTTKKPKGEAVVANEPEKDTPVETFFSTELFDIYTISLIKLFFDFTVAFLMRLKELLQLHE